MISLLTDSKRLWGLTRKKLYKEHYALHDVNFDISEGECVGIIGTNGSGKSTILKIITGVLDSYRRRGKSRRKKFPHCWNWVPDLIWNIPVPENVYLNGTMIGFSKEEIDARLDDILEFADIEISSISL